MFYFWSFVALGIVYGMAHIPIVYSDAIRQLRTQRQTTPRRTYVARRILLTLYACVTLTAGSALLWLTASERLIDWSAIASSPVEARR